MPLVPVHNPREPGEGTRVGGARADFVAHLGRRVAELKQALITLEADPRAARVRDDLRRRVHALASAARILKFHRMGQELANAEHVLARATSAGSASEIDVTELRATFDSLPTLAWGDSADASLTVAPPEVGVAPPENHPEDMPLVAWPATALVVGASSLADALTTDLSSAGDAPLECERTDDPSTAIDLARALAPDVVLLDADLPGAESVAERLLEDPLTEPVPVVVVGSFPSSEQVARWVALGVSRVLVKPASPASIQAACLSAVSDAKRSGRYEPMGSLTVDELAQRLAEELRRGLTDATSAEGQRVRIDLGDGYDVMAALWSAVSRIREVTTIRSRGAVRFSESAPEGAVALASLDEGVRARGTSREGEPRTDVSLTGRTVLVADDDPAVTWFLSGVLRAAGATVLEAHDGEMALAMAYRASPELVISDILMPKLDGFAMCRALKRDVALRDVPVILLSWKEDLLQRVRELGASADGYLRKEASAQVVLSRAREVLRPRVRVETRLASAGEVRGRLDGLTVRTLLTLVAKHRPDARVSIRDASFLYEIEIRDACPRRATRTAPDGSFERGQPVLASALGVGAGRFVVGASEGVLRTGLDGTLDEQLRPHVAKSRAAQKLLCGPSLLEMTRVDVDTGLMAAYVSASPQASRQIIERLAEGMAPRALLLRGGVGARLLEDVLGDAAVHGAVTRINGPDGQDVLQAAAEAELAVLERGLTRSLLPPPRETPSQLTQLTPSPLAPLPSLGEDDEMPPSSAEPISPEPESAQPISPEPESARPISPEPVAALPKSDPPVSDDAPSLAVLASIPPPEPRPVPAEEGELSLLPPEAAHSSIAPVMPTSSKMKSTVPSPMEAALLDAIPVASPAPPVEAPPAPKSSPPEERLSREPPETVRELPIRGSTKSSKPPRVERAPASAREPAPPPEEKSSSWGMVAIVVIALLAGALWFGRDVMTQQAPPEPVPTPPAPRPTAERRPLPMPTASASASTADDDGTPVTPMVPEDLPLAPGDVVPDGNGMLEVLAGRRDDVLVDRLEVGRGPTVKVPLPPGSHDVRARRRGDEQPIIVIVKAGRRTRVDLRGPWKR